MKAQSYLSNNGKKIFAAIHKHLKETDIKDVDTYKLSMLADAFDDYEECTKKIKVVGVTNKHDQISPYVSAREKALNAVLKLSPSFGIDLLSREKISSFSGQGLELPDIG